MKYKPKVMHNLRGRQIKVPPAIHQKLDLMLKLMSQSKTSFKISQTVKDYTLRCNQYSGCGLGREPN